MQADIEEPKLFSFDGKSINFYRSGSTGELRIVDTEFNEINKSGKNHIINSNLQNSEHANAGDISFQVFFEGLTNNDQNLIKNKFEKLGLADFRTNNNDGIRQIYMDLKVGDQKIRAGMIVALGGYYSLPDEPIAWDIISLKQESLDSNEIEKRFLSAFETLVKDEKREVQSITKQIGWEGNTIHGLIKRKARPSIVMGAVKASRVQWASFTSRSKGWKDHIPGGFFIERYIQSATMNFDHFGEEAEKAYKAGHHLALKMASNVAHLSDEDDYKWQKFSEALGLELFACHFFADLFVSGHVRTPRRRVFEILNDKQITKKKWIAALFANLMHDEDNANGVYVCSESNPDPWEAIGDYRYADDGSSEKNEKYLHYAVVSRLQELYQVFQRKIEWSSVASAFKKDIPKEATPEWLDHCKCKNEKLRNLALAHAHKFPPFLKIGKDNQLQVRPYYRAISREKIIHILANILSQGIKTEIKELSSDNTKEITRIKSLTSRNISTSNNVADFTQGKSSISPSIIGFNNDYIKEKIFNELYMMDEADEIAVAIETPYVNNLDNHD